MSETVPVLEDGDAQKPIPSVWRGTFSDIVDALKQEDYGLAQRIAGVRPISTECAISIASNIKSYGARLTSLPEETWQTSVCQWMGSYWDVLVDLYTIEEGASDLALAARVYQEDSAYVFEVQLVYVP